MSNKEVVPSAVAKRRAIRHTKAMNQEQEIVLSYNDAQQISGVLELHICAGMARSIPEAMQDRVRQEIKQLNKIQRKLEKQLDVSSAG